jgi:hypothetical protein
MIGTRAALMAAAGALALPTILLQAGQASAATTNPGAAAGDAVVAVGRQDSGPPVRIVHSANSTGATNHVQLVDSGMAQTDVAVIFPRIGGPGGTVTLSTVGGSQPPACSPLRWSPVKADEHVVLRCNTNALEPAAVHVSFTRAQQPSGSFAYAFANRPTITSYVPDSTYQFATSGKRMTVTRLGHGTYQVRVPHVQTAHGVVQVTAVGSPLATCRVVSWKPVTTAAVSDQLVRVTCGPQWSAPNDSAFTLTYSAGQNLLGMHGVSSGWAYEMPHATSSNSPVQWSSTGARVKITRSGQAHYAISGAGFTAGVTCTAAPDLPTPTPFIVQWVGTFVQLTNAGASDNVCTLTS